MNREEKNQMIASLEEKLSNNKNIYLADISGLEADQTSNLRRLCFSKDVALQVVKNNLLKKAMEKSEKDFEEIYDMLVGNTSLMTSEVSNAPAKVIKEFKKKSKSEKPLLKTALIEDALFIGNEYLDQLASLKSKEELIAEVIALLQAPMSNVMSSLNSGKNTVSGILTALASREN